MRHTTICLAAMAGFVFATSASAANLGSPVRSAPDYAAFNWTGPYIGASVGYAAGTVQEWPTPTGPTGGPLPAIDPHGGFVALQAGYNQQFGWLVVGLESDFTLVGSVKGGRTINWCPGCFGVTVTERQDAQASWLGTTRGRIGIAWDRVLLYGTGGVAYGQMKSTDQYNVDYTWYGYAPYNSTSTMTQAAVGWTVGGGLEFAFARNWTARVEALHVDMGVVESKSTCNFCTPYSASTRFTANIARLGVNYKF